MFRLVCDNDSHWYIIPTRKTPAWDDWCEIGRRDPEDAHGWEPPSFAIAIDGPTSICFDVWGTAV